MIHPLPKFKLDRTLFASLSVALTILPMVVQAAAPATPAAASPDRLPALVAEALAQFQLVYRSQPAEGQQRQEQLNAVVAASRTAPRNESSNEQLNNWLRAAIRASMPGAHENLPPMPTFTTNVTRQPRATAPTPAVVRTPEPTPAIAPRPTPAAAAAELDPFRDDPAAEQESKK